MWRLWLAKLVTCWHKVSLFHVLQPRFEVLMGPNWMKLAKAQLDESRAKATTGGAALLEYAAGYYLKLMRWMLFAPFWCVQSLFSGVVTPPPMTDVCGRKRLCVAAMGYVELVLIHAPWETVTRVLIILHVMLQLPNKHCERLMWASNERFEGLRFLFLVLAVAHRGVVSTVCGSQGSQLMQTSEDRRDSPVHLLDTQCTVTLFAQWRRRSNNNAVASYLVIRMCDVRVFVWTQPFLVKLAYELCCFFDTSLHDKVAQWCQCVAHGAVGDTFTLSERCEVMRTRTSSSILTWRLLNAQPGK